MWRRAALLSALLLAAGWAGCVGDAGEGTTTQSTEPGDQPVNGTDYGLPATITGLEQAATVEHGSASGLVVHEGYAYVAGLGAGFYVVDIQDPEAPEKVAELEELYARDADVLTVDGTPYVALAAGGGGMHLVNVSDPTDPKPAVTEYDVGASVHNLATVPGTTLIYNSRSLGDPVEPGIDIVDVSDPAEPTVEAVWTFPRAGGGMRPVATTGCHDVTVYPDADRAYCAGVTQTYVLGIEDPTDPTVLGTITNPAINIHHWAMPANDHSTLIIGDEFAGAAGPACLGHADTPTGDVSQPTGGLWFYDISDPSSPTPQGFLSAPTNPSPETCTAHFGTQIGDRPMLAVGWYTAGLLLVDFSDPTNPDLVDQWNEGSSIWDVRYTNGHLVTGDIGQGTQVLRPVGS